MRRTDFEKMTARLHERLDNVSNELMDTKIRHNEMRHALMEMLSQHCSIDKEGHLVETAGISANEKALQILIRSGYAKAEDGRAYRLRFDFL